MMKNGTSPAHDAAEKRVENVEQVDEASNLLLKLQEIEEYVVCFIGAKLDRGKYEIKQLFWKMLVTVSLVLFASAVLLLAFAFTLYGVVLASVQLFALPMWFGFLASGILFFAATSFFISYQKKRWVKKGMQRKVDDYEQKLAAQRRKFGRNLEG